MVVTNNTGIIKTCQYKCNGLLSRGAFQQNISRIRGLGINAPARPRQKVNQLLPVDQNEPWDIECALPLNPSANLGREALSCSNSPAPAVREAELGFELRAAAGENGQRGICDLFFDLLRLGVYSGRVFPGVLGMAIDATQLLPNLINGFVELGDFSL